MSSPPLPLTGRNRAAIVDALRRLLPRLESVGGTTHVLPFGLDALDAHLPHGGLATGALHEVAPQQHADTPAAFGFLVALLARFQPTTRPLLLVASHRALADHGRPHGHGLQQLGLDPARLILVETRNDQQTFWALEEALRSRAPTRRAPPRRAGASAPPRPRATASGSCRAHAGTRGSSAAATDVPGNG